MLLEGDKINLRELEKTDTEKIIKWRNAKHVLKNFIIQDLLTVEKHNWWFENKVNKGLVKQFIIICKESNTEIGSVFVKDIDLINKKGEYGIFIGEENFLGKGLGTEAAKLICDYMFTEVKLNKIYLRVYLNNKNAIRSYKKVGFEVEGILKEEVYIEKKYFDIVLMGKFKDRAKTGT